MQAYYTYSSEELMEKAKLPVFCMGLFRSHVP